MASTSSEFELQFQAALAALQRGEREQGRALLLAVVEGDPHHEQAWLWLSRVVDDPADRQVALENVLTINPANTEARHQLETPALTTDHWQSLLPAAPQEPDDGIDDPLQCVYCGAPTLTDSRRCPRCGRDLYVRLSRSSTSEFLRLGLLLFSIDAGLGLLQVAPPLLALNALSAPDGLASLKFLTELPGAPLVLGNLLALTAETARLLAYSLGARSLILIGLALGLSQRWTAVYFTALAALGLDILVNIYLLFSGLIGPVSGVLNLGLAVAVIYLTGAAYQEFTITWERLRTMPDPRASSAAAFYKLGHDYSQKGMWGLAVAQWRKAVGLAPKETSYYKHLGIGYARLRRYARSLRVLEEAARRAPQDRDLPGILAIVREQAEREQTPSKTSR